MLKPRSKSISEACVPLRRVHEHLRPLLAARATKTSLPLLGLLPVMLWWWKGLHLNLAMNFASFLAYLLAYLLASFLLLPN